MRLHYVKFIGRQTVCENYRSIPLLNMAYKVAAVQAVT